jgi:hypothetical protein
VEEIKTDVTDVGYEFMERIDLFQDHGKWKAYVKVMLNFWTTKYAGNAFASWIVINRLKNSLLWWSTS